MGVTIHFEGRLKSRRDLALLVELVEGAAAKLGWPHRPISEERVHLPRLRDERDWDYVGPTTGIEVLPHERSDPLRLEFDSDLYVQEFIKTQFAGPAVHTQVVQLLRRLEPHFESLAVEDEGEFWFGGDNDVLQGHFSAFEQALAEHLRQHPDAQGPVRSESGRWVDVIS
jgi:hypothetical protein